MFADLRQGAASAFEFSLGDMQVYADAESNEFLYFNAKDNTGRSAFFETDGTVGGTRKIKDLDRSTIIEMVPDRALGSMFIFVNDHNNFT